MISVVDIIPTHLWPPNDINTLCQLFGLHNASYRTNDRSVGKQDGWSVSGTPSGGCGGRVGAGTINMVSPYQFGFAKRAEVPERFC
jgi:hypothetical protein